ncbi:MAG: hypothetical protein ACYTGS_08135 [Planctomycetota bacterium]
MCEHCTRREFLGTGVAGGLMLAGATWTHAWASQSPPGQPRGKSRIGVIFTGTPVPVHRNWGADVTQIEAMKARLARAEKELGNVELVMGQSSSTEETAAVLKKAGPAAPVLVINVQNFALTRVVTPILDGSHPMVFFSLPASGHDWMYAPRWHSRGHRVTLLASSDYDELERALRLLRVIPMMKQTRILLFPPARRRGHRRKGFQRDDFRRRRRRRSSRDQPLDKRRQGNRRAEQRGHQQGRARQCGAAKSHGA